MVGCRNTGCEWGGTCGLFYSADATSDDVSKMAGVLCQCGCPGARHTEWYEVDDVETKVANQSFPAINR